MPSPVASLSSVFPSANTPAFSLRSRTTAPRQFIVLALAILGLLMLPATARAEPASVEFAYAELLNNPDTTNGAFYADGVLTIPTIEVGGIDYWEQFAIAGDGPIPIFTQILILHDPVTGYSVDTPLFSGPLEVFGNSISWSGTYFEDGGTTQSAVTMDILSSTRMEGDETWTWSAVDAVPCSEIHSSITATR